ncbi:hypothetical protein hrd7_25180 [Leptolinea sp. HRD-7]|nr:hypothetical protein hrd7_25180 [Leptolinea sp. HRD-7]
MFQETLIVGMVQAVGPLQYLPMDNGSCKRITVETVRNFRDNTGQQRREKIIWRVSAWDKWADWADKYVRTGMYLQVRGRLHADEITGGPVVRYDKNKAQYVSSFDLVARDIVPWGGTSLEIERLPIEGNEVEDA